MKTLFEQDLKVINIGLQGFADNIRAARGNVSHLSWSPPAGADAALGWTLANMIGDARIDEANRVAYERYLAAQPRLVDFVLAREAIPALNERRILHSGPPIAWADMCGPQQGAICGAILYEGWAATLEAAEKLAASGAVALEPCHTYGAVGPMAGIISPSMPVWVVENTAAGNRAFCNVNEGLGKVLRFGANSPEVIDRLRWLGTEFFSAMQIAVRGLADANLKPLMAQALHMGDEVHNRNAAASGLLFKRLTLALLGSKLSSDVVKRALTFVAGNDHFFLNLSMAACKSMSDAAHGVPGSSMVTVMARNGVNFGIRLSGTGDQWFQAPGQSGQRPVLPRLHHRGCRRRPGRFGHHRDEWTRRVCDGGLARHRAVRRRQPGGRNGEQPAHALHHAGQQSGVHLARAQLRRHTRGHRREAGGRLRCPADHQHGDRPQEGGCRPDRRRYHHRADGVLQPGARGTRQDTRRSRRCSMSTGEVLLAVNGTLMRGLKLNPNMIAAKATFVRETKTERAYRLWTINDEHPAMVRVTDGKGVKVAVEVWSVPAAGLAGILLNEPPGLSIGKVKLEDGSTVLGVLGEPALVEGQREITSYGGWRAYIAAENVRS